ETQVIAGGNATASRGADCRTVGQPRGAAARTTPGAGLAGIAAQGREESGAGTTHQRTRLPILGLGRGQVLVRNVQPLHQGIQLLVLVDLPPGPAKEVVG